MFVKEKSYSREDGVKVTEYKPVGDFYIKSINPKTGEVEFKKIIKGSKHENLKMFKISHLYNEFTPFWCSSDHSLIVYDEKTDSIIKIKPEEILKEPERYYLIKSSR